jgi:hypothetical protein
MFAASCPLRQASEHLVGRRHERARSRLRRPTDERGQFGGSHIVVAGGSPEVESASRG